MKRLFAFLLACVCALALFGCAGANDDKSDGGPEDDWAPLTEAQIEEFKEMFASEADVMDETTGEYRYTTSTPVSCFFTSHYDDPRDIDLAEFLRYCPLSTTLGDADVEEFHAVLDTLGIENSIARSNAVGKRNYAMTLLASRLGLRASDIANLQFGEIDWDNNLLTITIQKTRKVIQLPLLAEVGNSIVDYLKNGRPKSSLDQVFLSVSSSPVSRLRHWCSS